ncbi:Leucine-rich repeat-containing protein 67 [Intoshia linei]|uniref:Leucine-rich repeat-containing protein 67 n=1 Tax=Intoshia linei TaxID=1819745 RepID=A0A177AZ83_9BILA|nr:Leucine-rich repeat-containing protein 67 [Intoshia linei]
MRTCQFLKRISHAYLQNKNIEYLGTLLEPCKSLRILYLYENNLRLNPTLVTNTKLTHVYLQHNLIEEILPFANLPCLEKLYLSKNNIRIVNGLENLVNLRELYIDSQNTENECMLEFDQDCILSISKSLILLDIHNNKIQDLTVLWHLNNLQHLNATENKIEHHLQITNAMNHGWKSLKNLNIENNPITTNSKEMNIVISSASLVLENLSKQKLTKALRLYSRTRSHDFTLHPLRIPQGNFIKKVNK